MGSKTKTFVQARLAGKAVEEAEKIAGIDPELSAKRSEAGKKGAKVQKDTRIQEQLRRKRGFEFQKQLDQELAAIKTELANYSEAQRIGSQKDAAVSHISDGFEQGRYKKYTPTANTLPPREDSRTPSERTNVYWSGRIASLIASVQSNVLRDEVQQFSNRISMHGHAEEIRSGRELLE